MPGPPLARTAAARPPKISPAARLVAGQAAAIRRSARAVGGSPPSSDTPPRAPSVVEVTGTPYRRATSECASSWASSAAMNAIAHGTATAQYAATG